MSRCPGLRKNSVEVGPRVPGGERGAQATENLSLLPEGSVAVRIHSVGGWGAMTMGKNLTLTHFDLLGMPASL